MSERSEFKYLAKFDKILRETFRLRVWGVFCVTFRTSKSNEKKDAGINSA
jgi:hypothetical protein